MQKRSVPLHDSLHELGYPIRLEIVSVLADGPLTVNEIVAKLQVVQTTVSKHLADLRAVGIVSVRREGVRRYYSLDGSAVMNVATQLTERISVDGVA